MRIAISADHAGFPLKNDVLQVILDLGHEAADLGAHNVDPNDDYPDFAAAVGNAIASGTADRGVVLCGSGVGASIAANKIHGVRAGMCHDTYSAHQGVEHDDMNVLCLGGRVVGPEIVREVLTAFLGAQFQPEERYLRRLNKVKALETGI